MKLFCKEIKLLRIKSEKSVSQISKLLEINRRTYYTWENGSSIPSETKIRELAAVFGVSVDKISNLKNTNDKAINNIYGNIKKSWISMFDPEGSKYKELDRITLIIMNLKEKIDMADSIISGVMQNINIQVYIKNLKQRYVIANSAFLKNLSLPSSYLVINKTDFDFFTKKEAQKNYNEDKLILLSDKPSENKEGYILGTRKKKWGLISKYILRYSDGQPAGIIGITIDITHKRKNEKSLKTLEFALDEVEEGVWAGEFTSKDKSSYEFHYINKAVEKILGTTKKNMFENTQKWVDDPELWAEISPETRKEIEKTRAEDIWPRNYNYKAKRKSDNADIWISERMYLQNNFSFGFVRDVTDFCRLNEYKEILFEFLDMDSINPFWLYELKPEFKLLFANKAIENLINRNRKLLYSDPQNWRMCVHPDDIQKILDRRFTGKEIVTLSYRIINTDGKIIEVTERSLKIIKDGREIIGGVIIRKKQ